MLIKDVCDCKRFIALDGTNICELLHPDREDEDLKMECSLAHASLGPNEASKPHILSPSSEVYYILEGEGIMHIDEEEERVQPRQVVYIPPNSTQYIENVGEGDLNFLCIVSPVWRREYEKVLTSKNR